MTKKFSRAPFLISIAFCAITAAGSQLLQAQSDLYTFPKIDEQKVTLKGEKKPGDPFVEALSQKMDVEEKAVTDNLRLGIGRGDLIRLILMSRKSGKTLDDLVKERQKGTRMAKIAEDLKLDNREIRAQAFELLKEIQANAEKIRVERVLSSSGPATDTGGGLLGSLKTPKANPPAKPVTAGVSESSSPKKQP